VEIDILRRPDEGGWRKLKKQGGKGGVVAEEHDKARSRGGSATEDEKRSRKLLINGCRGASFLGETRNREQGGEVFPPV